MALYPELQHLAFEELVQRWAADPIDGRWTASSYYPELATLIAHRGDVGFRFLLEQRESVDQERVAAALHGLTSGDLPTESRRSFLRDALRDARPRVLSEAIRGLGFLRSADDHRTIIRFWATHQSYVRVAILDYLGATCPIESFPLFVQCLRDTDPLIRSAAVDELDEIDDEALQVSCFPFVWPMLDDEANIVRQAAQYFLASRIWTKCPDQADVPRLADLASGRHDLVEASRLLWEADKRRLVNITAALKDPAPVVRLAAVDIVARAVTPASIQALSEQSILEQLVQLGDFDSDMRVRQASTALLAERNDRSWGQIPPGGPGSADGE